MRERTLLGFTSLPTRSWAEPCRKGFFAAKYLNYSSDRMSRLLLNSESPRPASETPSACHPPVQRNTFRRPSMRVGDPGCSPEKINRQLSAGLKSRILCLSRCLVFSELLDVRIPTGTSGRIGNLTRGCLGLPGPLTDGNIFRKAP